MTRWGILVASLWLLGGLTTARVLASDDLFTGSIGSATAAPHIESSTPIDTAAPNRYFQPQWRAWSRPTYETDGLSVARTAPYIDSCFDCPDEDCWFFEGGLIALKRTRWEGGQFISKGTTSVLNKEDLDSHLEWGGRFSVGTRCTDCSDFEVTGFFVTDLNEASSGLGTNNVSLPVFNPPPSFDAFGDDASRIVVNYHSDVGGVEILWRRRNLIGCCDPCCGTACSGRGSPLAASLELGVRYLYVSEDFSIYSQSDATPDPAGVGDYRYSTSAINNIVGPEIGVQIRSCPWLCFDVLFCSRLALAANFIETNATLRQLQSNPAFDKNRDEVAFAQVWDNSLYLRMRAGPHIDLRVGYQFLWVNGYAAAPDQFSRNLGKPGQLDDNNGVLFHGPAMLMQISF